MTSPGGRDPAVTARAALALAALGLATGDPVDIPGGYERLKRTLRAAATRDPIDSLLVLVVGGSYLFWLAERDENPRCPTFLDALEFITTNLSVGFCDIFAQTDAGKAIAAFVMTFGPALTAAALDPPAAEPDPTLELGRAILGRLDAIAEALQRPSL